MSEIFSNTPRGYQDAPGAAAGGEQAQAAGKIPASPADFPNGSSAFCCPFAMTSGFGMKNNWRYRHPFFFWFLLLIFTLFLFCVGIFIWAQLDQQGVISGPRLGIVRIEGMLLDSKFVLEWNQRLGNDPSVHGVLVYINSPGGAVVPSQEIHAAIKSLAAKKPVVVYMSSVAASGGYYAAIAGDYIVASPSTLTGSIGVRMELPEVKELLDTLGIHSQSLASGPFKEAGTFTRPLRADEREYLQGLIQDMYETFLEDISKDRKIPLEDVRKFAEGKAYTGRQALALGLVDELGDMASAMNLLIKRCELSELPKEILDGPKDGGNQILRLLRSVLLEVSDLQAKAQNTLPGFYY